MTPIVEALRLLLLGVGTVEPIHMAVFGRDDRDGAWSPACCSSAA